MKIGVLGAPGAGKTKFAQGLAKSLGDTTVVDNYVQRLQKSSNLALGPWASYSENMMIAGVREAARLKQHDKTNQITVGTIMDTMVYIMVHCDNSVNSNTRDKAAAIYQESHAVVNGMTLWYNYTWDYDVCFHLPYAKTEEFNFSTKMNEAYSPVLETFFVPVYGLEGDTKGRVEIASQVIEILERDEASRTAANLESSKDEKRSVRSSSKDGTGVGDSPRPMPDVPLD